MLATAFVERHSSDPLAFTVSNLYQTVCSSESKTFVNQQEVPISETVCEPEGEKVSPSRLGRRLIVAFSLDHRDERAADQTTSLQRFVTVTDIASSTAPPPEREPMASTSVQNEAFHPVP